MRLPCFCADLTGREAGLREALGWLLPGLRQGPTEACAALSCSAHLRADPREQLSLSAQQHHPQHHLLAHAPQPGPGGR